MNDKILLVTAPDDIIEDAFRVLLVDLTTEQNSFISSVLIEIKSMVKLAFYIWNGSDPVSWLLDKKLKSHLIIFNAESDRQNIIGYMSAQPNSYYLGNLKDLNIINNSALLDKDVMLEVFENQIGKYERLFK
jgi:hypothetical protein